MAPTQTARPKRANDKSKKKCPKPTKKLEKSPPYALVFYIKDKSKGVVKNREPTLSVGETYMAPLPIDMETEEPATDVRLLKSKVLSLGHNPEFLYETEVNLQGEVILEGSDPEVENRAPRIKLDLLKKDSLHAFESNALSMQPIFPNNIKLSASATSETKETETQVATDTFVNSEATSSVASSCALENAGGHSTVVQSSVSSEISIPEKPALVSISVQTSPVGSQNISVNDKGSSERNNAAGTSNQSNLTGNLLTVKSSDGLPWPCLQEDASKMRIVNNIDVFARRSFVHNLPKVVPQTPEYKGKKIPPKEIFGTALFPRGMTNHILKELVPPGLAYGIKKDNVPEPILMVIQIAVNTSLDRSMKATKEDFTTWISDFGRNFKRDRKSELYSRKDKHTDTNICRQ